MTRWLAVIAALPDLAAAVALRHVGPAIGDWGFNMSGMSSTVLPGDDFFFYANGQYIDDLTIPPDKTRWGSFNVLHERTLDQVKAILEENEKMWSQLGRLYASYIDEATVEQLDVSPIALSVAQIHHVHSKQEFALFAGLGQFGFLPAPFALYITEDQKDPTKHCIGVDQSGLGLPNRDYYLQENFKDIKAAYAAHITKILGMVDWPDPRGASDAVLAFEDKIAEVSWSSADMRDSIKTYNPMGSFEELLEVAPGFDWVQYFNSAGLGNGHPKGKIVVGALSAVTAIARLVSEASLETLQSWMAFHFVAGVAPKLSKRFVDASFEFNRKLSGQEVLSPRWQRAVSFVTSTMGDELAQEYVKRHFPPESKAKVEDLCAQLKDAFRKRLQGLTWMTEETKAKALEKLESQTVSVGYPKHWRSFAGLEVHANDLFNNARRGIEQYWSFKVQQLYQPVDQEMWDGLLPHEVNAYNMPLFNKIVFPAAILQAPFFDLKADMAVNYGAIGAVIGHEMMHSFDDQGRHYDAKGQLHDWWTADDEREFNARADKFMDQFAKFDLTPVGVDSNVTINPQLTMGEALADLGGITLAVDAYRASQQATPQPPYVGDPADGMEGLRRVFLGYAQVWQGKTRVESMQQQITTDPHPPAIARVDIPARNLDSWYAAFGVSSKSMLYMPDDGRVKIW